LVRAGRYLIRLPLLLLHIVVLLPLVLLCMVPLWAGVRVGGERLEHRVVRAWSAGLLRIFGFRLRRIGQPLPGAAMFVANHVSWIDIEMLHSQRMMGFVAKAEIRGWPLVGWLAARGETIFHQRGSSESLDGVMLAMRDRLREGRSVGVFPEGRTRDGHAVGPFHARIFTAAVEAGVPVQPVALRYGPRGDAQHMVAFHPGESFMGNFVRLLGEPARSAAICFLAPIASGELEGRKQIAELARARVVAAMAEE
jgi:1-acyl-sn-glycerol-3-phosphate acyltransferase